jgi:hypothetical protein
VQIELQLMHMRKSFMQMNLVAGKQNS